MGLMKGGGPQAAAPPHLSPTPLATLLQIQTQPLPFASLRQPHPQLLMEGFISTLHVKEVVKGCFDIGCWTVCNGTAFFQPSPPEPDLREPSLLAFLLFWESVFFILCLHLCSISSSSSNGLRAVSESPDGSLPGVARPSPFSIRKNASTVVCTVKPVCWHLHSAVQQYSWRQQSCVWVGSYG